MIKVISYSLWGSDPTYNIGAIRNAETAKIYYPDYQCWFYIHVETVPKETIEKLHSFNNVKIISCVGDLLVCKPRMWRFAAIDDPNVEVMLSRDTDSRFHKREILAVNEWLSSGKTFHIMRDHPHHVYVILAGMFGTRKISKLFSWSKLIEIYKPQSARMYDQDFLKDNIYEIIRDDCISHSTFHKLEINCLDFPIPYDENLYFVGEYIYSDNTRSKSHINELIRGLLIS